MFDLFRSRAKAVRIMLGALLGVIALSMLVYLIPGTGMTTAADSGDDVVAEIGKSTVTVAQIQQQLRNALRNQQLPPDLAATYIPQLVDQAISERAVSYEAERLGVRISDRDLADTLRSFPFATLPPDQYQQYIEQQNGTTVQEFEDNVRLKSYEDAVVNMATEGIIVTPADAQNEYRKRNEKIKVDYIAFDQAKLEKELNPSPDEVKAYFERTRGYYNMPETRTVQMIIAAQPQVAMTIQVSDAQVKNYYDSHLDQYRTQARVHARHILLSTTNKPKDEVPKIQAQAEALLKQIKGGADFAELAKKNSQDPGSAPKGGDLGWVSRGQMVKNFEDTVFALKDNELSGVVTTEYGFHIIQVLERQPAHLQSLDEAKGQIQNTLRNQLVSERMEDLIDQARAALVKAPQNAQQIAAQFNLSYVNVLHYANGTPLAELNNDVQAGSVVSSLKPGEVSQVMQAADKLAIAVVASVNPPHPAQLSEVAPVVLRDYVKLHAVDSAKDKANKALEMLKQNGDLKAAAKATGGEVKSTDFFSRSGAAEGIGSAAVLSAEFSMPVGAVFGPITASNNAIVGKISGRQDADMAKFAQERDAIVLQLKSKKYAERQGLLQDSVLSDLIQRGKVKKHQQVIDRLIAQYRS
jgi:peptidyl-prolyl cis-trans isomerase D